VCPTANKIKINPETPITFKESGGTVTFTPKNTATAAGRISARHDLGAAARASLYEWRARTKVQAAPTVGNVLEIYLATSDGTVADGNQGTSDAAFSAADKRRNLHYVGQVVMDKNDATEVFQASGFLTIVARYVSVVWWNGTGQSLTNVAGDHEFILTPVPDEVQ
jgi:hypothetical protein